jgi:hypothetical protein
MLAVRKVMAVFGTVRGEPGFGSAATSDHDIELARHWCASPSSWTARAAFQN